MESLTIYILLKFYKQCSGRVLDLRLRVACLSLTCGTVLCS